MNIFGVFSTQGSQGLSAVKGLEAAQAAEQATEVTSRQGVTEVHDAVTHYFGRRERKVKKETPAAPAPAAAPASQPK